MEGTQRADESEGGEESTEVTQAEAPPDHAGEAPSSHPAEAESKRAPRPSTTPGKGNSQNPPPGSSLASASKPPPFPSARPSRSAPLPPPPERPHPPSAAPPKVEPIATEQTHAVAAPDLKDATEPEPEGPPIQSIASVPVRELELMKSELAQLKAQTQRQGLVRAAIPYLALGLGALAVGYLLGDSTAARRRTEVRKVAMERYFSAKTPLVDDQKDALSFIQKQLAADDPELRRWAETQVSVIDERLAARGEREAALKVEITARGEELARVQDQLTQLELENKGLGEKILAFEAVEKKLDQLKLANIVLIQAKSSIERLSKRLTEVEETPEAKKLAD